MFSNGGGFLYEALLDVCAADKALAYLPEQITRVIFDSSPCEMNWSTGTLALVYPSRSWVRRAVAGLVLLIMVFLNPFNDRRARYTRALTTAKVRCGELYLYSDDDQLCPVPYLESIAAARKRLGVPVTLVRWKTSPHCAHLRAHPDEYTRALFSFLD